MCPDILVLYSTVLWLEDSGTPCTAFRMWVSRQVLSLWETDNCQTVFFCKRILDSWSLLVQPKFLSLPCNTFTIESEQSKIHLRNTEKVHDIHIIWIKFFSILKSVRRGSNLWYPLQSDSLRTLVHAGRCRGHISASLHSWQNQWYKISLFH